MRGPVLCSVLTDDVIAVAQKQWLQLQDYRLRHNKLQCTRGLHRRQVVRRHFSCSRRRYFGLPFRHPSLAYLDVRLISMESTSSQRQ